MGLFSSILHLRDTRREDLLPVLDAILHNGGFRRVETLAVPPEGPYTLERHDASVSSGPYYLVSTVQGSWLTVIEAHFALHSQGAPHLSDVGNQLSAALSCFALTLVVHDDDLFFYNLDRDGTPLDGYNSCPQYFERLRLADAQIEQQRHTTKPFQPLLPAGCELQELRSLLNRGWWNAYDSGRLDEHGVVRGKSDGFAFEGERMSAFGTLLQLHGNQGEYPYAAWGESDSIEWMEFVALRYRRLT
jgi:hypothetical protein